MDFNQRKLTKMEWESIEVPVSRDEKEILQMIVTAYNDLDYKYNNNNTLMTFMKIHYEEAIEQYLYTTYFMKTIKKLIKNYNLSNTSSFTFNVNLENKIKINLKKSDIIRLETNKVENILEKCSNLYEYVLLDLVEKLLKYQGKGKDRFVKFYYTLSHIINSNVENPNKFVVDFIENILLHFKRDISLEKLVTNASKYIEGNPHLLQYGDMQLYNHQKHIFQIFNGGDDANYHPKLALYVAPTATGKTMSPLGLSVNHKVIFVCAARHVGLALAKSALSVQKKVAFAFGCSSSEDIRLHFFASNSFVLNEKTGTRIKYKNGMQKTDHSDGSKVEIMICDIQSYIHAMYYMCSFHDKEKMITFWDEPTISLDYEEHHNHSLIQQVWSKNIIPNIVLSSATLPSQDELHNLVRDYRIKFENGHIYNVSSSDCKKTIPLIDNEGKVIMPHLLESLCHNDLRQIIMRLQDNITLLRYLDLNEIGRFITFVLQNNILGDGDDDYKLEKYFPDVQSITMENLKNYYIDLLTLLDEEKLLLVQEYFTKNKEYLIGNKDEKNVGMYITTKDAYTLTDGPTIFMTKNPEAIAKFCIQQANIPTKVLDELNRSIQYNTQIGKQMSKIDKQIEDMSQDLNDNANDKICDNHSKPNGGGDVSKSTRKKIELRHLEKELEQIQSLLKLVNIDTQYVPNSKNHMDKWISDKSLKEAIQSQDMSKPYYRPIDEIYIKQIMELGNVEHIWKLLLIMGIGMFSENVAPEYLEIMKSMAEKQKLFIIIATDDYIYGTNYQFCHGYISKDLSSMTQEKIIQALGRVGRNNIQQNYSIRFRNTDIAQRLFYPEEDKIEVRNMNRLFVTRE